jgi:hypothetical protein
MEDAFWKVVVEEFRVIKWKWKVHSGRFSHRRFGVIVKIKDAFKRLTLAKEDKGWKQERDHAFKRNLVMGV